MAQKRAETTVPDLIFVRRKAAAVVLHARPVVGTGKLKMVPSTRSSSAAAAAVSSGAPPDVYVRSHYDGFTLIDPIQVRPRIVVDQVHGHRHFQPAAILRARAYQDAPSERRTNGPSKRSTVETRLPPTLIQ